MTPHSFLAHRSHLLAANCHSYRDGHHHSDHYSHWFCQLWMCGIVYQQGCSSLSKIFQVCCHVLVKWVWILQCCSRWFILWTSELHHSFVLGNSRKVVTGEEFTCTYSSCRSTSFEIQTENLLIPCFSYILQFLVWLPLSPHLKAEFFSTSGTLNRSLKVTQNEREGNFHSSFPK